MKKAKHMKDYNLYTNKVENFGPIPVVSWSRFILSAAPALSPPILSFCPNPKLPRLPLKEMVMCLPFLPSSEDQGNAWFKSSTSLAELELL